MKRYLPSVGYWWFLAIYTAIMVGLAAINKYVVHIPDFPKWDQ